MKYIKLSKREGFNKVLPSQPLFLVYGCLTRTYDTKFIFYGITTYMFGACPNTNPSRPFADLLMVY